MSAGLPVRLFVTVPFGREYTTWLRLDPHSRAYGSLLNDTSRRMAQRLGLPQPAHQSALCLDCHAHHVPPAQRGERHVMQEGVSCEIGRAHV